MAQHNNVGARLTQQAVLHPDRMAIATPMGSHRQRDRRPYETLSLGDLDRRTSSIAVGLKSMGIGPGKRIALLVRFGPDFIALVFAVLKSGATLVLIDPGMGRRNLIDCLAATRPDGFIAIPMAHAVRMLFSSKFPNAKLNVTVGTRWLGLPAPTLAQLEKHSPESLQLPPTELTDPAAIIFTTGSTGPPKGVLYTHGTFNAQIDQVAGHYGVEPGGKDLSCFPLFGLFNAVMGTTTILPDMNPIRPADVDPVRLLDAIDQWQINQSFGSPALWTRVGGFCAETGRTATSLRRVLSAGAPVPARILQQMRAAMHPEGQMFTPYGATEALPIASIESRTVLEETAAKTIRGAGTCVGNRFSGIEWRVIRIVDGPLRSIHETEPLPPGEIGELMVRGPVVSREYVTRTDQNELHKVQDGDTVWHRMGDVGYFDDQDRFWFCGRKAHRVVSSTSVLFTEKVEAVVNAHPAVYRSALIGAGERGKQTPMVIVEPWAQHRPTTAQKKEELQSQILNAIHGNAECSQIAKVVTYPGKLPTDIRHNSKIFREKLTIWANEQFSKPDSSS